MQNSSIQPQDRPRLRAEAEQAGHLLRALLRLALLHQRRRELRLELPDALIPAPDLEKHGERVGQSFTMY